MKKPLLVLNKINKIMSNIKTSLIDSQPEECYQYINKILVYLSLNVLREKVDIKNTVA